MNMAIKAALDMLQERRNQIDAAISSLLLLDDILPGVERAETESKTRPAIGPGKIKTCRKCGKREPDIEFREGHGKCMECERAYSREWARKKAAAEHGSVASSAKLNYECSACHARFATPIAKKNHNCVRAAAAGEF